MAPCLAEAPAPMPARGMIAGIDAAELRALRKEEIAIARRFHGGGMWPYAASAVLCLAIWLSFFPLAFAGQLNLPIAFALSTVFGVLGYVNGHEAMHSNIVRAGERHHWLNEMVGWISTVIIVVPFSMSRLMHLEHHYHCNDPQRDPDYGDRAPNWRIALWKTWYNRQPGVDGTIHHYKRLVSEMATPEAKRALRDTQAMQLVYHAVLFAMAWSGHAIEAALIWWLPRQVALTYIRFFLSWAPHHPREGRRRYETTRVFRSRAGHILSLGMQYHLVHHLYPGIPNHRTRPAYHALKPILQKRGVDCSAL